MDKKQILANFITNYNLDEVIPIAMDMKSEYDEFALLIRGDEGSWAGVDVDVVSADYDSDDEDEVVLLFDVIDASCYDEYEDYRVAITLEAGATLAYLILEEES